MVSSHPSALQSIRQGRAVAAWTDYAQHGGWWRTTDGERWIDAGALGDFASVTVTFDWFRNSRALVRDVVGYRDSDNGSPATDRLNRQETLI